MAGQRRARPDRLRLSTLEGEDRRATRRAPSRSAGSPITISTASTSADLPNKGLAMWATPDPHFAMAQCRVWNDWAWEQFGRTRIA